MSLCCQQPLSRRSAIAGLLTSWAMLRTGAAATRQSDRPAPFDLGQGLEIRDYRLFPTHDVMRFIVELHNTTNTAVDTPTVGVILPNLSEGNFGWANPVSGVLHPHSSGCLIGVAPEAVATDDDWGETKWLLCGDIDSQNAERLADSSISLESSLDTQTSTQAKALVTLTNEGSKTAERIHVQGLVWDPNLRLSGTTVTGLVSTLESGQSVETGFTLSPEYQYIANPFALIDNVESITVSFIVQSPDAPVNLGCNPVMPWN